MEGGKWREAIEAFSFKKHVTTLGHGLPRTGPAIEAMLGRNDQTLSSESFGEFLQEEWRCEVFSWFDWNMGLSFMPSNCQRMEVPKYQ